MNYAAKFTMSTGASITLNPSSGGVGLTVSVSGSGFRTDDNSCTISGTGVQNPACSITVGTGIPAEVSWSLTLDLDRM